MENLPLTQQNLHSPVEPEIKSMLKSKLLFQMFQKKDGIISVDFEFENEEEKMEVCKTLVAVVDKYLGLKNHLRVFLSQLLSEDNDE